MAKIAPSDTAPSEAVHYSLAGAEFDLGGSSRDAEQSYETTDAAVIDNAEAHPWLTVEPEQVELLRGEYNEPLKPEDDALSAVNSVANDPDAIREAEANKVAIVEDPTAIDAAKDQDEVVETGGVNETLAADNADDSDNTDDEDYR